MVESGQAQPLNWNFTSRNVENDEGKMDRRNGTTESEARTKIVDRLRALAGYSFLKPGLSGSILGLALILPGGFLILVAATLLFSCGLLISRRIESRAAQGEVRPSLAPISHPIKG